SRARGGEGGRAHAAARTSRQTSARQSARLSGRRTSARSAETGGGRYRRAQSQEHQLSQGGLTMAEDVKSFGDLKTTLIKARPSEPAAEAREPVKSARDSKGRAYATGKRKNAVARVWIKPGRGRIEVNGKEEKIYFARP